MQQQNIGRAHEFGPTLKEYDAQGVPVDCGKDLFWTTTKVAVARIPRQSTLTPDSLKLFKQDIAYQVEAGSAKVVFWDNIKKKSPKTAQNLDSGSSATMKLKGSDHH